MKGVYIVTILTIIALIVGVLTISIYEDDTEVTKEITKVGVILNGRVDDESWGQSHYEGMEATAKELNLDVRYKENVSVDSIEAEIDEYISEGCEIIVANSFEFSDAIIEASEKYPEVYFLHATGVASGKNLSTYFGRMYQIRYLCGVVAGLQTKTNEIGYVAAFNISEVNRGINAFTLGVRSVNPDATVYVKWTNSWNLDAYVAEATYALLENHENIDIITLHTDSNKPLEIAEEKGIMSIGYNFDNSTKYQDSYLTAAIWDWENFYTPNILKCLQGKFEGGNYWDGIETGIISLAPLTELVDQGIEAVVQEEMEKLYSGTYDVFYGPIKDNNGKLRILDGESITDNAMLNEFDWYVEGVVIDEE